MGGDNIPDRGNCEQRHGLGNQSLGCRTFPSGQCYETVTLKDHGQD